MPAKLQVIIDKDLEKKLVALQRHYHLKTRADTIRLLIKTSYDLIDP